MLFVPSNSYIARIVLASPAEHLETATALTSSGGATSVTRNFGHSHRRAPSSGISEPHNRSGASLG